MTIKIDLAGYNRVGNKLRKLASLHSNVIDPAMKEWIQGVRRKLKNTKYPPKRPNQRYVRTGQLANRWKAGRKRPGVWSLKNEANQKGKFYAAYVVGDNQAWMHKGRWWMARDVVNEEIPSLIEKLTELIEAI